MARAAGVVLLLGAVALPAEPPVVVFAVSERFHPVALNWLIFFAASGTPGARTESSCGSRSVGARRYISNAMLAAQYAACEV